VTGDVAHDLAAAGGVPDEHDIVEVERLDHGGQLVGVVVHGVAVPRLARGAMPAPVVSDRAEAEGHEHPSGPCDRLGYAALHQLLTPFLDGIDLLPPPQARALKAAFGMSDDAAPDPFFAGLGALTLISAAATRHPLLLIVDDGQWLDQDSADALGVLARRLHADRVCLLMSMRDSLDDCRLFDGLPSLALAHLSEPSSIALLKAAVRVPVADDVRDRVLADARGNPLALVEFGRELSPDQLAGAVQLPPALPVDRRLESHFLRQVGALPPATQRLLLVVAAEPTGDSISILGAGHELDFEETAIGPAEVAGLLEHSPRIVFRHPLIRSAVYQGATPADRCRAHARRDLGPVHGGLQVGGSAASSSTRHGADGPRDPPRPPSSGEGLLHPAGAQ